MTRDHPRSRRSAGSRSASQGPPSVSNGRNSLEEEQGRRDRDSLTRRGSDAAPRRRAGRRARRTGQRGSSFADSSRDQANRGHVLNTPAWAKKYEAERLVALEKRLQDRRHRRRREDREGHLRPGRDHGPGEDLRRARRVRRRRRHPAVPDDAGAERRQDLRRARCTTTIPKPDRTKDNSTLWQRDYDRAHYENMYFNRMRKFYERESNGKFTLRRRHHRVGEGPLQPGPLRPQREQHHLSSSVTRSAYWVDR